MPQPDFNENLREEFNRWAEQGRGEGMEEAHLPIALPVLELMNFTPYDNVLDVGCGAGWLDRLISERLPEGRVVGVDVSDEMIRRARKNHVHLENAMFVIGSAGEIPWDANFFDKVISVESAYYWPDPLQGLNEIFRVLREGGSAWILINYYRDNPYCHAWANEFAVPTHLLSAEEWAELMRQAGFDDVAYRRIPDPTPTPETYTGRWFRNSQELGEFRREGALLIRGSKAGK